MPRGPGVFWEGSQRSGGFPFRQAGPREPAKRFSLRRGPSIGGGVLHVDLHTWPVAGLSQSLGLEGPALGSCVLPL